jgi:integrase
MARLLNRLASNAVKTLRKPGRHADGGGLYLSIHSNGGRRWTFLYRWRGKKTEMGLGAVRDVPLARARTLATEAREHLAGGVNPMDARAKPAAAVPTFGEVAERLIAAMRPSWKNPKHAAQWEMTLMGRVADKASPTGWKPAETDYCATLRAKPVNTVTTADVLAVLAAIWDVVPETASRLRGRIERVLAAAKAGGHRSGENPARWQENLKDLLPKRRRLTRGHHPAMRYALVPAFTVRLRERRAPAAIALELTILTAARTNETLEAEWPEFELRAVPVTARDHEGKEFTVQGPCWTVPPKRMKMGRIHQVPLVPRAVALLEHLHAARRGRYVFPGQKAGRPLSGMAMEMVLRRMAITDATPHGFRSSFRDWASETTPFPHEVVEMALAHAIEDKTEAAYRRGALFDKRRDLMAAWAKYCGGADAVWGLKSDGSIAGCPADV